jgi:hypothetical protein
LIWLRFCAFSLKVDLLFDAGLAEHMVTPAGPLCETEIENSRLAQANFRGYVEGPKAPANPS